VHQKGVWLVRARPRDRCRHVSPGLAGRSDDTRSSSGGGERWPHLSAFRFAPQLAERDRGFSAGRALSDDAGLQQAALAAPATMISPTTTSSFFRLHSMSRLQARRTRRAIQAPNLNRPVAPAGLDRRAVRTDSNRHALPRSVIQGRVSQQDRVPSHTRQVSLSSLAQHSRPAHASSWPRKFIFACAPWGLVSLTASGADAALSRPR
jgi:hypothetical protein